MTNRLPATLISTLVLVFLHVIGFAAEAGDKKAILDHHIDAMGGREALASIKTVTSYATIEGMGLKGKQTALVKPPFKYRVIIDMGIMSQEMGFDGITGWSIDPNGIVKADIAETLKPMVNEMFYATASYALPGGNPGKTVYRGDTLINKTNYHYLMLFPEGGDSLAIFLNSETGLVDYRVEVITGLKMITKYSDYRSVQGLMNPFAMEVEAVGVGVLIFGKMDSIRFNEELPDTLFAMPGRAGRDYLFGGDADSVVLEFDFAGNHILLNGMINGQGPFVFLLDSGAGATVLASRCAEEIGVAAIGEVPARGIGGFGRVGYAEIDSMNFGGLSLYLNRVTIIDMATVAGGAIGGIDGILGYDFFARFPMIIDFKTLTTTLYDPTKTDPPDRGERVDIEIFSQLPVMEALVNGQPIRLGVDLGAQPAMVIRGNARLYDSLKPSIDTTLTRQSVGGVGGIHTMISIVIDSLQLGDIKLTDQSVLISEEFESLPLPEYIEGLLGVGILKQFTLLIDYAGGRICFVPQP